MSIFNEALKTAKSLQRSGNTTASLTAMQIAQADQHHKQVMQAHLAQDAHLRAMREQMDAANTMQRQLLEAEYKKEKARREQALLKDAVFMSSQIVKIASAMQNQDARRGILHLFGGFIEKLLGESLDKLVEINDKNQAVELQDRLTELGTQASEGADAAAINEYVDSMQAYEILKSEINERNQLQPPELHQFNNLSEVEMQQKEALEKLNSKSFKYLLWGMFGMSVFVLFIGMMDMITGNAQKGLTEILVSIPFLLSPSLVNMLRKRGQAKFEGKSAETQKQYELALFEYEKKKEALRDDEAALSGHNFLKIQNSTNPAIQEFHTAFTKIKAHFDSFEKKWQST